MTSSTVIDRQARAAADRVDAESVGLGFDAIFEVILSSIRSLLACFRGEEPNPAEVRAAVIRQRERNPNQLQRRVRNRVIRKARRQGDKLSKEQADPIASAIINQCCEATSATVAACMVAAPAIDDDGDDS